MPWRSLSKPRSDRLEGGAAPADGWGGITQTTAVRCGSRLTLPARSGHWRDVGADPQRLRACSKSFLLLAGAKLLAP